MDSNLFWWCAKCNEEVSPSRVTHQERHEDCGNVVEAIEDVTIAQLRTRLLEVEKDLAAMTKRAEEAIAEGNQRAEEARQERIKWINQSESLKSQVATLTAEREAARAEEFRVRWEVAVQEFTDQSKALERAQDMAYDRGLKMAQQQSRITEMEPQVTTLASERDRLRKAITLALTVDVAHCRGDVACQLEDELSKMKVILEAALTEQPEPAPTDGHNEQPDPDNFIYGTNAQD
jgi:chromosome segregation ATPase